VYFLRATTRLEVCKAGTPLSFGAVEVYRVTAGAAFDLKRWSGRGGAAYRLSVASGVVKTSGAGIY
jgi:hypothetical protein